MKSIILVLLFAFSASANDLPWDQLERPDFRFFPLKIKEGSLLKDGTWVPTGDEAGIPEYCSSFQLKRRLDTANSSWEFRQKLLAHYKDCEEWIKPGKVRSADGVRKFVSTIYQFEENRHFRGVKIRLDDGTVLSGILGLRDREKRPLVVIRCGVTCNADNTPVVRVTLMHFFDESSFNILLINNSSGGEFIIDNQAVAYGGVEEAHQMHRLGNKLRDESFPLNQYIGSLHAVGMSLGANGIFFGSLLNDRYPQANGQKNYDSFQALCPVVDLKSSLNHIFKKRRSWFFKRYIWKEVERAWEQTPFLQREFPDRKRPSSKVFFSWLLDRGYERFQNHPEEWFLPPFNKSQFTTPKETWRSHRFQNSPFEVKTPLFITTSEDDLLVSTPDNSGPIVERQKAHPERAMQGVSFSKGNHCTFSTILGWQFTSQLMRSFISVNSKPRTEKETLLAGRLGRGQGVADYEFQASKKKASFEIKLKLLAPNKNPLCQRLTIYQKAGFCYRNAKTKVSFAELGLSESKIPRNQTEAQALTRWANNQLELIEERGFLSIRRSY